jgi:transcriptional regulator with XRE-family HTH domain
MLTSPLTPDQPIMAVTDKTFYVQLGRRIAEARKASGLTQVQLAETLGIAQQTLAHYENGNLRVAVALLQPLARAVGVAVEELIGEEPRPGKRGPAPKIQQQLERITQLPKAQQRVVMQMLDGVLQKAG